MNPRLDAFLRKNRFDLSTIVPETLITLFDREMDAGLAGRPSSLPMIPAYITIDNAVPVDRPAIVVDAGGTNLRVALVRFDGRGKAAMESFAKHRMPGTQGEVMAEEFYETLADLVMPLTAQAKEIGFCFSYPAEVTPDCDARLLRWTKQVRAPEVVGTMVGSSLAKHLLRRGCSCRVTVLNDTVAALLAGKSIGISRRYGNYVGFILGTGTNTAYVERNAAIRRCRGIDADGMMAINVESGSFDKAPRSVFDEAFDASTSDRGAYAFEKMISGAYMGGLGLTAIQAAGREGLLSPAAAGAIGGWSTLANKDLDDFCDNPFITENPFAALPLTDDDRRVIQALGTALYRRAAILAAVNIAAAVLKTGAGHDPLHPVCVNIDGSSYYRTRTAAFRSRIESQLRAVLEEHGVSYELVGVEDAPVVGAAVAALTRV